MSRQVYNGRSYKSSTEFSNDIVAKICLSLIISDMHGMLVSDVTNAF